MSKKFAVVTIGDAIMDIFLAIDHPTENFSIDTKTSTLHIIPGAKLLVDNAAFCLGGNACNVAVGLQRLGYETGFVAELGDDMFGKHIVEELQKEHVTLDFSKITPGTASTFSVGIQFQKERTLFVKHIVREHTMQLDGLQTDWLYLTSLGKEWKELYQHVLTYKKQYNAKLAFNPGSQQFADGVDSFKAILAVTDILFVNREEAEHILYGSNISSEKKENEANLLFRILRAGPKIVCMTDGEKGSYTMDVNGELLYCPSIEPVKYVGKTGAGDAYAAGFLAAYLADKSLQEAMRWGTHESIAVIGHIGAQTGLLTKEQLEKNIQKNI